MDKVSSASYMFGNGTDSIGDPPRAEWIPSKDVDERIINPRALTVCRYYTAGNCRRGSSCHYMHPPLVSVQEEYLSAEELDVHPLPQCEGWYHGHGFTAFPTHTTAQHAGPQCFDVSRDVLDNFSDFSSSNDSVDASDQSLNTTFKVMTIRDTATSGPFHFYHSGFSQPSPSLQYPNNTVTRHGNVAYPGYYRGDTPTGSNVRGLTHIKADAIRKKSIAYKTKPCRFFSASKTCSQGDKCTFIHDVEKVGREKMTSSQDREISHLPQKPRSPLDDFKARDFYPITWRVIGGGVMMGPPCRAFAAGHCPDGTDCKLAHETELETTTGSVVELKSQPSLNSSAESKLRGVSSEHSDSSPAIQGTYGGIFDGTEVPPSGCGDGEELSSAGERSSAKNAVSSQHRRSRSMSLPSSPSILSPPRIFAEL